MNRSKVWNGSCSDGPPPNICDTRKAGNKNPCKIFARVLKGDCGFTFFSRHGHNRRMCGKLKCAANSIMAMFAISARPSRFCPLGKKDVFQSSRYCHIFPYLPNTKRRNSSRRLKSFRRPDLRRRKRQRTFPTANWNRLPMRGAICGKRSAGRLRRP